MRGAVLLLEDLTERAQLEQDVETRANQLAALTEVSSRITASLDHSEVVSLARDRGARTIVGLDMYTATIGICVTRVEVVSRGANS